MSVSNQFHHTMGAFDGSVDRMGDADVVRDIRNGFPRPEAAAVHFRQEIVADLLTTRGSNPL